jgi:hypothetical protein
MEVIDKKNEANWRKHVLEIAHGSQIFSELLAKYSEVKLILVVSAARRHDQCCKLCSLYIATLGT